jgi:hypothetical protein
LKWAVAAGLILLVAVLMFFSVAPGLGQGWELEEGIRVYDGVSCCVIRLADDRYRMYFTRMGGIFSAVSEDGLKWMVEEGVRVKSPAANPAIIELGDGRYRMIYDVRLGKPPKEGKSSGMSVYFVSAISEDGVVWEEEGVCLRSRGPPDYDAISVPDIVELPDGRYRMYYTGDMFGPLEEREGNRVRSAVSSDEGRSWTREEGDRLEFESMDPEVVKLPDGRYRMYYTANPDPQRKGEQWVYSAISSDGLSFQKEEVVLKPRRGMRYLDPEVVEVEGGYRMYVSEASGQPPDETINIVSAYLAR